MNQHRGWPPDSHPQGRAWRLLASSLLEESHFCFQEGIPESWASASRDHRGCLASSGSAGLLARAAFILDGLSQRPHEARAYQRGERSDHWFSTPGWGAF